MWLRATRGQCWQWRQPTTSSSLRLEVRSVQAYILMLLRKNISYLTLSLRQCHQVAKKLYMDILTTYMIQEIMLEVVSHHNLFFKMATMFLEPKNF